MVKQQHASFFFLAFLGGLGTLGFFAADMYLPALPALEDYFPASKTAVGLTFSIYMLGLAIGQLLYGPISDRFGRKPTLSSGLILFLIATLGCIFSEHIIALISWRFLQALGACACIVVWQAIVIDKFEQAATHKIFALVFPLVALSPALAPSIGGVIISFFNWQVIFAVLLGMGLVLLISAWGFLKESTMLENRQNARINWAQLQTKYQTLLRSPLFIGHACTPGFTSAAYFCYLTASPFIFERMGYSATFIGLSYFPQTVCFMLGGFISKKLVDRYGAEKTIRFSLQAFLFFAVMVLIATVFVPMQSAWQLIISFSFMAFFSGIIYPTSMSLALNCFPHLAGMAAGLAGSLQTFIAFVMTGIMALLIFAGMLSLALLILLLAITSLIFYQLCQRKNPAILEESTL